MKKFNSKLECQVFCNSPEYEQYINDLITERSDLIGKAANEEAYPYNHGNDYCKPSEYEARYVQREIERFENLKNYFNNIGIKPGYVWVYNEDRHEADLDVDKSNLNASHPVFLEYLIDQGISEQDDKDEAYIIWENYILNSSINNLFKYTYSFKVKKLFSDDIKIKI